MEILNIDPNNFSIFYEFFSEHFEEFYPEYIEKDRAYILTELFSRERLSKQIEAGHKFAQALFKEGSCLGIIIGEEPFGGVGYLSWIGVAKEQRDQNWGSKLLTNYENYSKSKGAHLIEAITFERSKGFYVGNGYEHIGTREKGYFGLRNLIMNKNLASK